MQFEVIRGGPAWAGIRPAPHRPCACPNWRKIPAPPLAWSLSSRDTGVSAAAYKNRDPSTPQAWSLVYYLPRPATRQPFLTFLDLFANS